jgi:hypothetical protein
MRLNFAGVSEEDIREGTRRIGKAVREQLALISSLSGSAIPAQRAAGTVEGSSARSETPAQLAEGLADVVALPRRDAPGTARARRDR